MKLYVRPSSTTLWAGVAAANLVTKVHPELHESSLHLYRSTVLLAVLTWK